MSHIPQMCDSSAELRMGAGKCPHPRGTLFWGLGLKRAVEGAHPRGDTLYSPKKVGVTGREHGGWVQPKTGVGRSREGRRLLLG